MDRQSWVCNRLRDLGYAKERRIRLYGKDLQLVFNPVVDGDGYSVEAIECKSGTIRRMRISLLVIRVVEGEADSYDESLVA